MGEEVSGPSEGPLRVRKEGNQALKPDPWAGGAGRKKGKIDS